MLQADFRIEAVLAVALRVARRRTEVHEAVGGVVGVLLQPVLARAGVTARRYYLNLRLQRASTFLQYTSLPALDAAVACGFRNVAHFSRAYKLWAGVPPSADRQRTQQGARPILS
ncbi:MAG TPA: helix-turn-helix domain-containing protein [Steroidobacteraceae bacterium]|nr:helix-turn-helix domain-containing protein [Steroidobacteraceae bacterium]